MVRSQHINNPSCYRASHFLIGNQLGTLERHVVTQQNQASCGGPAVDLEYRWWGPSGLHVKRTGETTENLTLALKDPKPIGRNRAMSTSSLQSFLDKPRVFVLSDISNEPDDAESLVRFLLYSNQFDTEGIVAVTSTWMKTKVCPQDMHKIIDGYAGVVDNLNNHTHPDHPYPTAETLRSLVKSGPPVYGFEGVGTDKPLTDGHRLLLDRIEASSDRPLWVLVWGGTNVLAQVLLTIKEKYPADKAASLRAKLRVYTISDQDDTSAWIRAEFPDIFYISSVHAWNQYGLAAWTGIAGDRYYGFDQGGPDFSKMTKSWIKKNIQVGPLGSTYPDYIFIPEGDTPTFLYLIQNGLGVREHPEYGSWGGRYALTDLSGRGLSGRHYSDTTDAVVGADGKTYTSNQATIWRWRDTFQNDFASRIQWSLHPDFKAANHHPVLCVNDSWGHEALELEIEAGEDIVFDASSSYDPDGDSLSFKWWQYKEPTATQWLVRFEVSNLEIENLDPDARRVKRIMIQTMNKDLRGAAEAGSAPDNIAEVMKAFGADDWNAN
ncbi:cellulose-binding protein [Verticillium alfalfae VaMs.102]|uniref:Cellulose-binding protein n=1 Tax=Verticillium alfalfae (strain VaMs.102 / ATCC MYA-4576 / FGSC 10136) TaxID=526221 RepID=C9SBM9_VERA1|nr:cellulose-binding protein [Verticillium alfalfae VaMs.102]EEY15763.1 cellulose-binding protein [Verticillium alfalfae VaMs.102]